MNLYSPDELLTAVKDHLSTWDEAGQKISLFVAKDPFHPYELLAAGPNGLIIVLAWGGADPLGNDEADDLTLATQKVEVFLGYNPGLQAQPDASLIQGSPERPALLKLQGLLTRRLREMDFQDETDVRRFFRWAGTHPVVMPDGIPMRAFKMILELDTDVEETPPQEI